MSVSIDGVPMHFPEGTLPTEPSEPRPAEPTPEHAEPAPSSFERLLSGLGGNIERGERIVASAASGYASLDPAELIALQAGIYRYSEAVDLTAKLVDRATGAVRTVLQGGH